MSCSHPQAPAVALHVTRGASKVFLFTVRLAAGNLIDLTSAKVWFTVKNRVEDVVVLIAKKNTAAGGVDNQILVTTPQTGAALGQFRVFIDPADTALLDPRETYWCDAWVQLPGGPPINRQQVMTNRQLIIEPTVTTSF